MPLLSASAMLVALGPAAPARADVYPSKPIQFVCTYAPGGGTDITARAVGQKLAGILGQSVVVENRPGAGGTIGTAYVAKAQPDGYTIMLGSPSPLVIAPFLFKKLAYDPLRDLAPVTLLAIVPDVLVIHPSLPVKSVGELVKFARSHPRQLTFGSSGEGGSAHLAGELLMEMTGIDMVHVPYKGTGPAMIAVLSGEVSLGFPDAIAVLPHLKSDRLKVLAVTGPHRLPLLPGVPTVAETLPGYTAGPWYSVLAPAGTPPEIISKLNAALVQAIHTPDIANTLGKQGAELVGNSPAEFAAFMKDEMQRWGKVIGRAGIHAD